MNKTYLMILGVAAFGGCGDSVNTGQVDTFINTLASQACDWEFRCCKDPEIALLEGGKFTTKDACVQYHTLALENQLYIERLAVREGRLRIDGARQTACLGQLASKQCNADPTKPNTNPTNPMTMDACADVFVGATPVGSECIYSNECVDGARCVSDNLVVGRGVCVPYQKVGQICNVDDDCDPNVTQIYCAKKDFTCHVRGALGQPCAYTTDSTGVNSTLPLLLECDNSVANLYCDPTIKSCTTLPQAGQACLSPLPPGVASQCDPDPMLSLICDHGTTGGNGGICRAPGKLGDDCSRFACGVGLYCDRTNTTNETCQTLPTLGQSCQTSNGECLMPYFCNFNGTTETCAQPAQLGQDCSTITCDTNLYCDPSTRLCKAQLPDNAICTQSLMCLSGECVFTTNGNTQVCQPVTVTAECIGR